MPDLDLFACCDECGHTPPGFKTKPCPWCHCSLGRCCAIQHTRQRNRHDPADPGLCRLVQDVALAHARMRWARDGTRWDPVVVTNEDWTFAVATAHARAEAL